MNDTLALYCAALLLALFIAISKAIHEIGAVRPWMRPTEVFLQSLVGAAVGFAATSEQYGSQAKGTILVGVCVGAWLGAVFLDRLSQWILKRFIPNGNGDGANGSPAK